VSRRVRMVLQAAPADCGPACAAMLLSEARQQVMAVDEIDDLRSHAGRDGMSVAGLRRMLGRAGMETKAIRVTDPAALARLPGPQILFWDGNHFLIADGYGRKYVDLSDPAFGRRRVTWDEFNSSFSSIAIVPAARLPRASRPSAAQRNDRFRIGYMLQLSSSKTRHRLLLVGLMSVLLDMLALGTIFLLRHMLLASGSSIAVALVLALLSSAVLEMSGRSLRGVIIARTYTNAEQRIHVDLFQLMLHLDWAFFARRSKGDLLSRLEFVRELYAKLFNASVVGVFSLCSAAIIAAVLTVVSPVAGIAVAVIAGACFLAARLTRGNFVARASTAVEARVRLGSFTQEVLQGIEGLKGIRGEDAICQMWSGRRTRLATATRSERTQANIIDAIQSAAVRIAQVVVIAAVLLQAGGTVQAGNLFLIISLCGMTLAPVIAATRNYIAWGELESYIIRLNDLLDRRPSTVRERRGSFSDLTVDEIAFSFEEGRIVLSDISFTIEAGQHVGIWAPSGTGKTTLLRMLTGSLTPSTGSITVDGLPLLDAISGGFFCGIVPQEIALITGTIAENLRVAAPSASDEDLLAACTAAGMAGELKRMPKGLDTRLAANGSGISGGQRQRLAIARALLSNPDILLLDEATAALDYRTEQAIIENLRDRTLVVVSHRKELMAMMDKVVDLSAEGRTAVTS
jgi:ABC-type bacteriocin/lantibiotic exporter with double-glycine peptidase domain